MKKKDQILLEEAYSKILNEDFNSDRRLNAFSQNLQGRGFNEVYKNEIAAGGMIHVFANLKTGELLFIEVDASKNFKDGYVLTTDSASKAVSYLRDHSVADFDSLQAMLTFYDNEVPGIYASEMFPLKSYEDAFAQIGKRDRMYADRS